MTLALITGGAGFIGSHLAHKLLLEGERVRVLDSLAPFYDPALKHRNLEELSRVGGDRFEFLEGDLRDVEACKRAVAGVDCVVPSRRPPGEKSLGGSKRASRMVVEQPGCTCP